MSNAFQQDAFQTNAFQEGTSAKTGTGSLALTATLAYTGRKEAEGWAPLYLTDELGDPLTDEDGLPVWADGTEPIEAVLAYTSAGAKEGIGSATISDTPGGSGTGTHGGTGSGALVLTATLSATGVAYSAARSGIGSLTASATLTAAGTKDTAGTGSISLTPLLSGAGAGSGSATAGHHAVRFLGTLPARRRIERSGEGDPILLTTTMRAEGYAIHEPDDVLVLLLAA